MNHTYDPDAIGEFFYNNKDDYVNNMNNIEYQYFTKDVTGYVSTNNN